MAALEQLSFESARGGRCGSNRLHRGKIDFRVESGSADQRMPIEGCTAVFSGHVLGFVPPTNPNRAPVLF